MVDHVYASQNAIFQFQANEKNFLECHLNG